MKIAEIIKIDSFSEPESEENLRLNWEHSGHKTKFIGYAGNLEIFAEDWPLDDMNMLFFMDAHGSLMGEASVIDQSIPGFNRLVTVNSIYLLPEARGQNAGFKFYEFLLNNRYKILSDTDHTAESQKLWQRLAATHQVFEFDPGKMKVLRRVDDISEVYGTDNLLLARKSA